MLPFIAKGIGLLKTGAAWGGKLLKGGLIVGGTGVAAVTADQALNKGELTSGMIDGVGGVFGRGMQEAAQTEAAAKRDAEVADASSSFQWFFAKLGAFFSAIGLDGAAEWCDNKVSQLEERAFKIDQDRKEQRQQLEYGADPEAGTAPEASTPSEPEGEWSPSSIFHSAAYGVQEGLVEMTAGVTSLATGTYEALTTDKGWGESIAAEFSAKEAFLSQEVAPISKPEIDTGIESFFSGAGNLASYLIPAAPLARAGGGIVAGLANAGRSTTPQVQRVVPQLTHNIK